jgi:very-short-patch-repair endonuclease
MHIKALKPRKALNKAFLKVKPNRTDIEQFKSNLIQLLNRTNDTESEEFHKNLVSDFLKDTYYKQNHFINTKGRNDLVIHTGPQATSAVGVIIEAKKPTNKSEMLKAFAEGDTHEQMLAKLNVKAFQELVLYYLRERITHKNLEVKYLIATNINEWFIFDATLFDRLFAQNKNLVKQFSDFEGRRMSETKTDFFYKQIAEPFIATIKTEIEFTYFNFQDYRKPLFNADKADDNKLIALFKLLSPEHLLKLPFVNDSNSLDKRFYLELLHIIGLNETKEGGKKLIERNKTGERHTASILEDAIIQLDSLDKISRLDKPNQYGNTTQEKLFNVALELSITWINRILFLKLLEAQLITYHKGDKSYAFLNLEKIKNYDDLNSLFFQVLARKHEQRNEDVLKAFEKVPYLNSSLFEPTEIEQLTIFISNLKDDKSIPLFSQTVLKDQHGKKLTGHLSTLEYIFEFLNAYDFSSEGSEDIQEDNKTLINASVLGLIFEKINGYKDGSFFTPGFITMYMCRETIRKAVVQKFNESPLLRGVGGVSPLSKDRSFPKRIIIPYNPNLKQLARNLRNNSTKSEITLWNELKGRFEGKYDFHRQKPLNNFIADFFCHELKLVIEIDGDTHNWVETQQKDFEKESRLNALGLNVLRFPDTDVYEHLNDVLKTISLYVEGYENGDLSAFNHEDTPLNSLSRGEFALPEKPEIKQYQRFKSLDDVYEQIGDDRIFTRQQANDIVNSIKICDPAVGSGHFLVSALNEMIAVKNDLRILQDRDNKRLKEYQVEVVNDELIVTDEEGELFEYNPNSKESQRIQETLFHEKQSIIENCLFGVDINPNSVKICRLRLWIELLKNAYYKNKTELETLPNIDINIKCGNSLVSRFAIDADLKQALKKSKWTIDSYRTAVDTYRNAENKEQKREMERLIAGIKSEFRSEISLNDLKVKKLKRLSGELFQLTNQQQLFEMSKKEKADWNTKVENLSKETRKLEAEIEEIKANRIFENAFEWRFEFPEVLNDEGDFVGFDVVIGNPPYIRQEEIKELKSHLRIQFKLYTGTADVYIFFLEKGFEILKKKGIVTFIFPNKFMQAGYGQPARNFLLEQNLLEIVDFGDFQVFEEATTYPCILSVTKEPASGTFRTAKINSPTFSTDFSAYISKEANTIEHKSLNDETWVISNSQEQRLLQKVKSKGEKLEGYIDGSAKRGILTGLTEAFLIGETIMHKLIALDKKSKDLIKPFLLGRNVKPYIGNKVSNFLLLIPKGLTIKKNLPLDNPYYMNEPPPRYGNMEFDEAWQWFSNEYPAIANHLLNYKDKAQVRTDQGDFWWELRACDYYDLFLKPKIMYQVLQVKPCFIYDEDGLYCNNSMWFIPSDDKVLLGILNSKMGWWLISKYCTAIQNGYQLIWKYFSQIPIAAGNEQEREVIADLVNEILASKKQNPSADTTDLENQIDQLVYQLYDLTEEEIKIVEGTN